MDQQQLATFFMVFLGLVIGAITGGGTVIVVYGRAMKAILNSPVIIRSLEVAAESWPAPVREAVADTGKLLEEIGNGAQTVTTTQTVTQ
jgi:hypothetical protein